jgi:hypothetical protein
MSKGWFANEAITFTAGTVACGYDIDAVRSH